MQWQTLRFVVSFCIVFVHFTLCVGAVKQDLIILQYNDINGQLERFREGTDPPIPESQQTNTSAGGLAPLIAELKNQTQTALINHTPILKISPGNLVGGASGWLSILGWETYGTVVQNHYKPNIMSLGLNEFGAGLNHTNDYIQNAISTRPDDKQYQPIVANLQCNFTKGSIEDKFCNLTKRYHIDNQSIKDYKIGFLGFVNPLAMNLSEPGELIFENVASSLLAQINQNPELKSLKTIIAVGSGNQQIAQEILDKIEQVKLVIYAGGRSGDGTYPKPYGKMKYIASSSKFKYNQNIGKMTFSLDMETGELELVSGEIVKIKDQYDSETAMFVASLKSKQAMVKASEPIGHTLVNLDAKRATCWKSECNLGNLITDAMVHCSVNKPRDFNLSDDQIGVLSAWTSGSIVDNTILRTENLTGLDVHRWLPYHNDVYLVSVNGSTLREMFQISGTGIVASTKNKNVKDWGQLLQVSNGFEVYYSEKGEIQSLKTIHLNDSIPAIQDVKDELIYPIIIPSFIYHGRSVYYPLQGKFLKVSESQSSVEYFKLIGSDDECVISYIQAMGTLINGFDRRIYIGSNGPSPKCEGSSTGATVTLTLIIFLLVIATAYVGWKFLWPYLQSRGQIPFHNFSSS